MISEVDNPPEWLVSELERSATEVIIASSIFKEGKVLMVFKDREWGTVRRLVFCHVSGKRSSSTLEKRL